VGNGSSTSNDCSHGHLLVPAPGGTKVNTRVQTLIFTESAVLGAAGVGTARFLTERRAAVSHMEALKLTAATRRYKEKLDYSFINQDEADGGSFLLITALIRDDGEEAYRRQ